MIPSPAVLDSQFGVRWVRTGPPPRDRRLDVTVAVGGVLPGTKMSAAWRKGKLPSTGSCERSLRPSRLRSNPKNALTSLLTGHNADVQTLSPLIRSTSFCRPWSPQISLYLTFRVLAEPARLPG